MKVNSLIIIGILVFVGLVFYIDVGFKEKVCIGENCFYVDVVDTANERSQGLMWRKYLGDREGMLFVFEESDRHGFWMKNTFIPLDMIWIENNSIVHIEKAVPCEEDNCTTYIPDSMANLVLEINGNLTDKLNISIGDKIE